MHKDWYLFQEEICDYFRSLGFDANTNIRVKGVRTYHDIDILVKSKFMGRNLLWIIEAKDWTSKVNKLQPLALRTIVDDIGADKGFIISRNGFQTGAFESTNTTNIELLTLEELKADTREFIEKNCLEHYTTRISILFRRYKSHDKFTREKYCLKLEHGDRFNSVYFILRTAENAIENAITKKYPINLHTGIGIQNGDQLQAENIQQIYNWLNINLNFVDEQILNAEIKMQENDDFYPRLH